MVTDAPPLELLSVAGAAEGRAAFREPEPAAPTGVEASDVRSAAPAAGFTLKSASAPAAAAVIEVEKGPASASEGFGSGGASAT